MVMEAVQEDTCTDHPFKNNSPGGICAFCLQEKLGKLVTSSFPIAVFPTNSSSLSSSPSFRSDTTTAASSSTLTIPSHKKSRLPFLLPHKNKKQLDAHSQLNNNKIVFGRSKSTVTPRRPNFDTDLTTTTTTAAATTLLHNKRKFFSFLYIPKLKSNKKLADAAREIDDDTNFGEMVEEAGDISPGQVSFDRKVSRSRSVGCGSRSFSGDFFERISTGFGDCTLRRVESQREGKARARHGGGRGKESMKERVKCGGLFSGFMITSSSSSSSSSSNWVPENNGNGKSGAVVAHARSRSWGWAFASPMRAFSKNSSAKRAVIAGGNKNGGGGGGGAPNLAAIPSILAVRS